MTALVTEAPAAQSRKATSQIDRVRDWCLNWDYRRLLDPAENGAPVPVIERFDWNGRAIDPGFRRVRVIGRQLYVLSRAASGGVESAGPLAERVATSLMQHGRGKDGQFVSRLAPDGTMLDDAADLYDIAFALFGLAWWYRYSGDARAIALATASVAHLTARMRSPSGDGFVDRLPGPGKHLQNPHMHLFEAAIFLTAFTGQDNFRKLAQELFDLTRSRLVDPVTGTLAEEFDAAWRPVAGPQGKVTIEPGHQFEWAWLLDRWAVVSGDPEALHLARDLFDFAFAQGRDPYSGLILDAVCPRGEPLERNLRIWPNTELLKAQVAMAERSGGKAHSAAIDETIARIFRHYLAPRRIDASTSLGPGFWVDYLKADATQLHCDHVPASTMYHIMFAFSEALRFHDHRDPFDTGGWMPDAAHGITPSHPLQPWGDLR
jgi:mannose/cellobiose epimerase-like protein (N-acyl-D-glucosamine 2-epimerase family)